MLSVSFMDWKILEKERNVLRLYETRLVQIYEGMLPF
jgi:hypothetical protein